MRPLLVALLVLATSPATAMAATVSVRESPPNKYDSGTAALTYLAGEGERNDVTLVRDLGVFVIRDDGAPLTPGAGCAAVDAHAVRCVSRFPVVSATADLRDQDDELSAVTGPEYLSLTVYGSDGHDVLTGPGNLQGGAGPDVLTGSDGQDTLSGGAGDDLLRGLGGDDLLSGDGDGSQGGEAPRGNDLLEGGPGLDTASWTGRAAPVRVNLADRAFDGEDGERDQLVGIENAVGGHAADVLSGDAGPNALTGGDGNDVLAGRDGADALRDGAGADLLLGGAGNDVLLASGGGDRAAGEGGDDQLTGAAGAALDGGDGDDAFGAVLGSSYTSPACGPGHDRLVGAPKNAQRIGADCEEIRFHPFDIFHVNAVPLRRAGSVLSLPAGCGRLAAPLRACDGMATLRLRRSGRAPLVLGRRHFVIAAESSGFVRVLVRRAARRALAQARRPLLDVRIAVLQSGRKLIAPGGVDITPRTSGRWTVRLP